MSHLSPAHHETIKHDSPNELRIKEKQKQNYPGFEFKSCQVNDSSQSNQGTVHLVSQPMLEEASKTPPPPEKRRKNLALDDVQGAIAGNY
jgi:hypothetical protein